MFTATITLIGKTRADLDDAATEVRRLLAEGYLSGSDSNDTGSFHFDIVETHKPVRNPRKKD